MTEKAAVSKIKAWQQDWNLFASEALGVKLDAEQQEILRSVQVNPRTSVASGTARGKDFISAVAALCFLYLTPQWNGQGELMRNTKVAMTAPTDRQVGNIMFREVSKLYKRAKKRGVELPGRLTGYDIRTESEEWFLTGFKADQHNHEAWSGFHAANTMFIITEASGIPEDVFTAIEGNLQGNSRILIVFNPNVTYGYAAQSQRSSRWKHFRLNSLNAPNVIERREIIPGQVDYAWVLDKVHAWCQAIPQSDYKESEGDFSFVGDDGAIRWYRPNDTFRIKVLGMFPRAGEGALIPQEWIELAHARWREINELKNHPKVPMRLGVDIAGMGRDNSCFCPRYGNYVESFHLVHSAGEANHMENTGRIVSMLKKETDIFTGRYPQAFIDTIGEGAGVYSRLIELAEDHSADTYGQHVTFSAEHIHSVKFSAAPEWNGDKLQDITGQYKFLNMRAYLFWAVRDWLNPDNKTGAALPPDDDFTAEATEIQWKFLSDGKIQIESKDDLKKRLKRSPDRFDALANTFYPVADVVPKPKTQQNVAQYFF